MIKRIIAMSAAILISSNLYLRAQTPATDQKQTTLDLHSPPTIWDGAIGNGFRKGATDVGFKLDGGIGLSEFGSTVAHDLVLTTIHYGRFSRVMGRGKWYQGNWELRGEFFAGGQYSPEGAYVVGVTPVLRYTFSTGTRWVPFFDAGAGVTATDIKQPDLSTVFQFNDQVGPGVLYFCRNNLALTAQTRFLHISNAGIKKPNEGVNVIVISAGMSWFF
jgi:lipid A 3-O-deacylase